MCVTTPIAADQMAGPELTVELAQELFRARRLKELIGVAWDATPQDIKAAGKRTLLAHHPDKGGDPELFKIVQPAVVLLQREEYLYAFPGVTPDWAKAALCKISALRDEQARHNAHLEALRAQLEAANTESSRAPVRGHIARVETALETASIELQHFLHMFGMHYKQHVESERRRQQIEAERRERAAAERAQAELEDIRTKRVIQRRKQRGLCSRFPTLPNYVENEYFKQDLAATGTKYRLARRAAARLAKQGKDTSDVDRQAAALLHQGRAYVAKILLETQLEFAEFADRFPKCPAGHPNFEQSVELKRHYTKLKDRLWHNKNNDRRSTLEEEIADVVERAYQLARQQ